MKSSYSHTHTHTQISLPHVGLQSRPHGAPWHWTSTSKLRHRLLSAMRLPVFTIGRIQQRPCAVQAHFFDSFCCLADSMRNPCGPRSVLRLVASGRTRPASYGTTIPETSLDVFGKRQILEISLFSSFAFLPMWFDTTFAILASRFR